MAGVLREEKELRKNALLLQFMHMENDSDSSEQLREKSMNPEIFPGSSSGPDGSERSGGVINTSSVIGPHIFLNIDLNCLSMDAKLVFVFNSRSPVNSGSQKYYGL